MQTRLSSSAAVVVAAVVVAAVVVAGARLSLVTSLPAAGSSLEFSFIQWNGSWERETSCLCFACSRSSFSSLRCSSSSSLVASAPTVPSNGVRALPPPPPPPSPAEPREPPVPGRLEGLRMARKGERALPVPPCLALKCWLVRRISTGVLVGLDCPEAEGLRARPCWLYREDGVTAGDNRRCASLTSRAVGDLEVRLLRSGLLCGLSRGSLEEGVKAVGLATSSRPGPNIDGG